MTWHGYPLGRPLHYHINFWYGFTYRFPVVKCFITVRYITEKGRAESSWQQQFKYCIRSWTPNRSVQRRELLGSKKIHKTINLNTGQKIKPMFDWLFLLSVLFLYMLAEARTCKRSKQKTRGDLSSTDVWSPALSGDLKTDLTVDW